MSEFKETVIAFRKKHGLSLEKLARELNVSYSTVNGWEKGIHKPTYIYKLAFDKVVERFEGTKKR